MELPPEHFEHQPEDGEGDHPIRLADLRYHLIWTTRRQRAFLQGPLLERAVALFQEAAGAIGARVTQVGSGGHYVVVTVEAPPELSPALIVVRLKRHSAGRLRREFPELLKLPSVWTRDFIATTEAEQAQARAAWLLERQRRGGRRRVGAPRDDERSAWPAPRNRVETRLLPPLAVPVGGLLAPPDERGRPHRRSADDPHR